MWAAGHLLQRQMLLGRRQQPRQQQQQRHQSDYLKQRAVEALKSKNNAAATRGENLNNTSSEDKEKNYGNPIISGRGNISNRGNAKIDFGDDHHGGLTEAVAFSSGSSGGSVITASATALKTSANPPPKAPSSTTHDFSPKTNSNFNASANENATVIQTHSELLNNTSPDPNPWAHMQLHEFAPKIVVVGIGGAGTNAVNNMVASGLTGNLWQINFDAYVDEMSL